MFLGPLQIASIEEWTPAPGKLVIWHPSEAALAKAREAPVSDVPVSYIQRRHLRGFVRQGKRGIDHSRLFIAVCALPGQCDIRAMTYVINAHLRRHATYRSWFECHEADQGPEHFERHTISDPADIEFVPTRQGSVTAEQLREHAVNTPDSLHWDCFRFGVVQSPDHFTFWASVDHLHIDGQFVGVGLLEFQMMYNAVVSGAPPIQLPPAGSYDDYCTTQRRFLSTLTVDSPQVQQWLAFAEKNDGTFPKFALPVEDETVSPAGDLASVQLMDERQTDRFEDICVAAGARFIGGLFAAAGHALHELTGIDTYYTLTPIDTRTPEEQTTQGWFTGLIPITVPVAGTSFADSARAAQECFDRGKPLAQVPFERVVELVPSLRPPQPLFPMLNFFDASSGPLAPLLTNLLDGMKLASYSDGRVTFPLSTLVGRYGVTTATVVLPKNPVARASVDRYVAALKAVCDRVTSGTAPLRTGVSGPAGL